MNDPLTLSDEQIDYLRELMNIGSGNAAATLTVLLKTPVVPKIPDVYSKSVDDVLADIGDGGNPATGAVIELTGDVKGLLLFYCRHDTTRRFATLARLHEPRRGVRFDDSAIISIIAQVVAGSHLATVRRFSGLSIDHIWKNATPDLVRTLRESPTQWRDIGNGKVVVVRSEFELVDFRLSAFLLIIPDRRSLSVLTGSIEDARRLATGRPKLRELPEVHAAPLSPTTAPEKAARIALSETELDYLTELMNIGAGNAAQTLSILLRGHIDCGMPTVRICSPSEIAAVLGPREKKFIGVRMTLSGDVSGFVYFVISAAVEQFFATLARARGPQDTELKHGPPVALAAEAVVMSYMAAVRKFCGLDIRPSESKGIGDVAQALILEAAFAAGHVPDMLVVQSDFTIGGDRMTGDRMTTYFLMFPDRGSIPTLTESIAEATRRMTGGKT